jgi:hypothetical protein
MVVGEIVAILDTKTKWVQKVTTIKGIKIIYIYI